MSFVTDLDMDSMWNMKTKTSLSFHRWIEKPKLSVAGLNIPIENISDIILKKSKQKIEESIDQSVNDNFSVRQK